MRPPSERSGTVRWPPAGTATVIRGAIASAGPAVPLPAAEVQRRLKDSFDPAGILAPVPGG